MAGPSAASRRGEGALELVDVAQVARLEADLSTLPPQLVGERPSALLVEVDEPGPRALGGEGADDLLADAGCAAGDEHHGRLQAGIARLQQLVGSMIDIQALPLAFINFQNRSIS